jgi:two-component system, cell cycle sensor histidine kinase and response regulator CckA
MAVEQERICHKRILLADDEPHVRESIKLLLGIDEHTVVEAVDGPEALDLFSREKFDLVITDYEMPKLRGNEVAVNIKRMSPAQPIIMITAYPENVDKARNPVDAILHKPFNFADLRQTIAKLLA